MPRRPRSAFWILLLALLQTVHAAKNRGWLGPEQLVRGSAPLARQGYGIAAVEDLTIVFGGDVLGSMSLCSRYVAYPSPRRVLRAYRVRPRASVLHVHPSSKCTIFVVKCLPP